MATTLVITEENKLAAVRAVAKLMDAAIEIPGTKIKFGLDTLIGLIPGVGDAIGSAIGGYIIMVASNLGVPRPVLWRMTWNLAVDAAIGVVPFVGDALDVAWKANLRNVRLLEDALADPQAARRGSRWMLVGIAAAVLLIGAAGAGVTWLVIWLIAGRVG